MPYRDLRAFLATLEKHQELRTIHGADWNLEIGTITELNYERQGPALLFDSIKGYPKGFRVLANAMDNLPRSLLALDLPVDLDMNGALESYTKKIASYTPVPPVHVETGPVFENVFTGDEIDLWKFPTPLWHDLGTSGESGLPSYQARPSATRPGRRLFQPFEVFPYRSAHESGVENGSLYDGALPAASRE